jgi:sporulation integral membrane protein YtvI
VFFVQKNGASALLTLARLGSALLGCLLLYVFFAFLLPLFRDLLAYIPVLFLPFIAAVLIAVSIEPLVDFSRRRLRLKPGGAVALSLLVASVATVAALVLILYVVIQETAELYHSFFLEPDALILELNRFFQALQTKMADELPPHLIKAVEDSVTSRFSLLQDGFKTLIDALIKLVLVLPNIFIFFVIAVISGYFIARDRFMIRNFLLTLSPDHMRLKASNLMSELFFALIGFFKAYAILTLLTMLFTLCVLKAAGVRYAFSAAILVGLLDIIPVLGPGLFFLPWSLYCFAAGRAGMGVAILAAFLFISVARQFLEPKILGDNIGLHPLATIVALYAGLKLGGVTGMIMGPVILVFLAALYRTGIIRRPGWMR